MQYLSALFSAVGLGLLVCASAAAQSYPSKPIRFVVPFAPGGNSDRMARLLSQKLLEGWGVNIVVDNRAGAGGTIGAEVVAKAPADGYTLLLGTFGSIGASAGLYKNLSYDPVKSFSAVTLIATPPLLLATHPSLPAGSVKELVAIAKKRPGDITFVSSGNGSSNHLIGELFNKMAGIRMMHIPYKGASPALVDVISGRVHTMFAPIAPAMAQVKQNRLRPVAVTTLQRSVAMPEIPTIAESGVPGFEAGGWDGVLVPAGTPQPIVMKLNEEIVRVLKRDDVRKTLEHEGAGVIASSPEAFSNFIKSEVEKWKRLVNELGVTLN